MSASSRLRKLFLGLGACGGLLGAYIAYRDSADKGTVYASSSWSNSTPSPKWDSNWDRRDPSSLIKNPSGKEVEDNYYNEKLEKMKPKAARHLIFIRHGQYNLVGKVDEERYLTELGMEQADLTGRRLKELSYPYSVIVQSTMLRAKETANIIAKHLPGVQMQSCDLLREGAPISSEPRVGHWKPEAHFYIDGARIEAAFRQYFHRADVNQEENSYEIFVCHANVIRYFVCRALQFPPEAWLRMSLYHGSITYFTIWPNGRVILRALGDAGHMPPSKMTTS